MIERCINIDDLVSIITPSYNTAQYIGETIQCVLNQTYTNWEMIIIDDCSTDDTDKVISSFDDKRIFYFKNEVNSGAAISRNCALLKARGRWIAFLDSDDLWLPNKLEKQINFMKKNHYSFSCTYCELIDASSKDLKKISKSPLHITKTAMYYYCWPGCLTVMYDVQIIGLIQIENLKRNNDYAMWLKVVKKTDCYCLPEILSKYRVRNNSISHTKLSKLIYSHYILFRKAEKKSPLIALLYTLRNLIFGMFRKIFYIRKI